MDGQFEEAALPQVVPAPTPPLRSVRGRDLLMAVGIIWGAELAIGVAFLAVSGGSIEDARPIPVFISTALGLGVTTLVSWHFVCRKHGRSLLEGFSIRAVSRRTMVVSVVTGVGGAVVALVLINRFGTGESYMAKLVAEPVGFTLVMLLALTAPLVEEVYYRGFLFPVLRKKLGAGFAILLVTVWFGAPHAFQLAGDWVGLPVIVAMGGVWTLQRHRSNSLVPSMVCHWSYNAVLCVVSVVQWTTQG